MTFPFFPDVIINNLQMLLGDPTRSFFRTVVFGSGGPSMSYHFWVHSKFGLYWRLFAPLTSPSMWEKAAVEFITSTGQKISGEIIPMVVLLTNSVEEGSPVMVTTFCHHDQTKVEPPKALSTLLQWNPPKLSIVLVKILAHSPYLPWGSFGFPYLDVTTLAVGMLDVQFPLAHNKSRGLMTWPEGPCWKHRGQCQQWTQHSIGQREMAQNTIGGSQQWHGCLWEYWRTWLWGQDQSLWWQVYPRWVKWECSWFQSGISFWGLSHMFRHWGSGH